jgi:DNA-directed RNA polymerase subunit M/transcription elongation factor TFIIS
MSADFEGQGSTDRPAPKLKCPKCKQTGHVHYTGSSVMHGNPYTPAADTEVTHYYECKNCNHEWETWA